MYIAWDWTFQLYRRRLRDFSAKFVKFAKCLLSLPKSGQQFELIPTC